jgi:hypothetical protein
LIVTLSVAVPQVMVYVVWVVSAGVVKEVGLSVQAAVATVPGAPGPVMVQESAPEASYETTDVFPACMRIGEALMFAVAPVQANVTLSLQVPHAPVQLRIYAPEVVTLLVPEVAPPVLKPVPVQLVAPEDDQVRVEGTVLAGFAERLQVGGGGAATETAVQFPQLLPSSDSLMAPESPADDLSAQARTYQVAADGKV